MNIDEKIYRFLGKTSINISEYEFVMYDARVNFHHFASLELKAWILIKITLLMFISLGKFSNLITIFREKLILQHLAKFRSNHGELGSLIYWDHISNAAHSECCPTSIIVLYQICT